MCLGKDDLFCPQKDRQNPEGQVRLVRERKWRERTLELPGRRLEEE